MRNQEKSADHLLIDGCLDYSNDHRDRHVRASGLLAECPELATSSIWCAAAVGDVEAVEKFLRDDPGLLECKGGPKEWEPLLYACYSRISSSDPDHSTMEVGRVLLERGANANSIYWWRESACPSQKGSDPSKTKEGQTPFAIDTYAFTALTGVCGEGEGGPVNQPRHPQWRKFAELLLKHGARPDDNQALYNRMFGDGDELLELLLAHGLNNSHYPSDKCTGGKPAPSILGYQLGMAASRGIERRVRLLLKHKPRMDELAYGKTPWQQAIHSGHLAIARLLEEQGAPTTELSDVDRFVSVCLGADRASAELLLKANPKLMDQVPRDLLARTASSNQLNAARLILELGFPVNAIDGNTALHQAGWHGRRELAEMLIAAGADLSIRDRAHYATPGDWARHNGQIELAEFLNSIRLDLYEAIGNNLVDRIEGIVQADPGSLQRSFKEYHGNPRRPEDSLSPLEFARKRGWDKVVAELERLGAN